jgi:hypothetical protein
MEKKKYVVKIENPCNQDFSVMPVSEKGHFCANCSKHVVDFRYASDEEILRTINNTNRELCGRLREDQLNRTMVPVQAPSTSSFFARAFSAFLLFTTTGITSAEQQEPAMTMQPTKPVKDIKGEVSVIDTLKRKIQGTLYDVETKKPIAALIVLKHKGLSTTSNSQGYFEFSVSEKDIKDSMILEINAVGFKKVDVIIHKKNSTNIKLFIKTEPAKVEFMGKMRCVPSGKK